MAESALPDELIHEIFLRLHGDGEVFALFCCALTCKRWRRLVAGSSFLRRRWPSSLLGFFASQTCAGSSVAFVPTGISEEAPALGDGHPPHRRLSSYVRDAPDYLDRSEPLTSRGSLLLVSLFSDEDDPEGPERDVACLAVCDLLAGRCYVLPALDCDSRFDHYDDYYGYAILSSRAGDYPRYSDNHQLSPKFRVLMMIGQDKHEARYNLHVFTCGEQGWNGPLECFNTMEHRVWSIMHANAIVCRGYVHWLLANSSNFYVLNFNAGTSQVSLTKLISPSPQNLRNHGHYTMEVAFDMLHNLFSANRLTTSAGGMLLTLCVYRSDSCRLEMWTRQEDDDGKQSGGDVAEWLQTRVIVLKLDQLNQQLKPPATCRCLGERSGSLLIVDHRRRFYIADLETGALEEVTQQFRGQNYNSIVPVEIDWPTFQDRGGLN
ncbi:unnamed protein product [Alopecurus aequalis]